MTELRRRMSEDLQLRGMSARTQERYVRAVRQLAPPCHPSPEQLPEEALRPYFLPLRNVKKYSRRATTSALCGIKFFFEPTLKRPGTTLTFVRPPREKKLPVSLRSEAGREILRPGRLLRYRACLTTIDAGGWRLQEGTHLRLPDRDRARRLLHSRHGKGGKDRYVPLPPRTRERWRPYSTHRHPVLSVPAPGRGGIPAPTAPAPLPKSSVPGACREALKERGVHNLACGQTLRHFWAPPLLEAGVKLRLSQAYLGHSSPPPRGSTPP